MICRVYFGPPFALIVNFSGITVLQSCKRNGEALLAPFSPMDFFYKLHASVHILVILFQAVYNMYKICFNQLTMPSKVSPRRVHLQFYKGRWYAIFILKEN